jgi:hypothetical protein
MKLSSSLTICSQNSNSNDNGLDLKRFIGYNSLAVILAFGSNFLGSTSFIMTNTNPEYFRSLKFDQLYSIDGFQRYVDVNNYEVLFPDHWIIDQKTVIAKEMKLEKPLQLQSSRTSVIPDLAYTKPDSYGRENLSILKSKVLPGFSIKGTLGSPEEAGPKLMELIAPTSSNKKYTLLNIYEKSGMKPKYVVEYLIEKGDVFNQHCISVIAYKEPTLELYTLTAMAPESSWDKESDTIRKIADSFEINS